MYQVTHVLNRTAWQVNRDGQPWLTAFNFDDAIKYAAGITLHCEYCRKTDDVQPEVVSSLTTVLACKGCRQLPTVVNTVETYKAKLGKKMPVVRELSPAQFTMQTINEARKFRNSMGFRTTGSKNLDQRFNLPHAALEREPMPTTILAEEAPETCQLCNCTITTEFIDGVVAGSGWASLCIPCHKKCGIGLGTGRGQRYQKNESGNFIKVEG